MNPLPNPLPSPVCAEDQGVYDALMARIEVLEARKLHVDAAATKLCIELAYYRETRDWIPCTLRMPEDHELCLIYGKADPWPKPIVLVAEWWHGHDGQQEGEWCNVCYDPNDWLSAEEVTHWMSMPKPPEITDCDVKGTS